MVMIIDGYAHIYPEDSAEKIITSFTVLHQMEPTESVGHGTVVTWGRFSCHTILDH